MITQPNTQVAVIAKAVGTEPKEIVSDDYQPITDPDNVKRFVTDYFADTPILATIASCESHDRQVDKNGKIVRGEVNHYDVGVMQINELYHADEAKKLGIDIYTLDGNVAFAKYLYDKEGAKPWMSSSSCWSKDSNTVIARS
jgi:hypothetical protein